jgi:energy-coupling factor transporter ATP-binding protein EcfA2
LKTKKEPKAKEGNPPVKFIVPPSLNTYFFNFLDHYTVSANEPVMIVGETGVGKSMFLHIFKKLFQEEHGSDISIVEANCSNFEKNLSRAELFGYEAGAYTGATKTKEGLVDEADGGLLILEEVGELPDSVQAQLLTFIETGKYRGLGKKEKTANVRIVAATNREEALRNDFRHRFFPFYVPPLHKRRADVLYYLCHGFPNLIPTLTMTEVLALIAHNWPGNVREIDRIARLMLRHKMEADRLFPIQKPKTHKPPVGWPENFDYDKLRAALGDPSSEPEPSIAKDSRAVIPKKASMEFVKKLRDEFDSIRLKILDERYSFLDSGMGDDILNRVGSWNGDTAFLERYLRKRRVGLSSEKPAMAFAELEDCKGRGDWVFGAVREPEYLDMFERFDVQLISPIDEFDEAYRGYALFCNLFGQSPTKDTNVLIDASGGIFDIAPSQQDEFEFVGNKERKIKKLLKAIMRSLQGIQKKGYSYPDDPYEYWRVLCEQRKQYDLVQENKRFDSRKFDDIWSMTEDELRKIYYEGLLSRSGGNIRTAAKMAGEKETTFRARLDSLKVSYRRLQR